jgi:hypothetical protein
MSELQAPPVLGDSVLHDVATSSTDAPREKHRRFSRLSLLGAAVVGGIAKTWADVPNALAINGPYCCDLAFPNGPWCGGTQGSGNFSCPSGYHKLFWTCCAPAGLVTCWECTTSTTSCYNPSWICSNYSIAPGC